MKITYFSYLYDIKGVSAGSANKAIGFIRGLNANGHKANIFWRMDQPEDYEGESVRLQVRQKLKTRFSRIVHDPKRILKNILYLVEEQKILRREKSQVLFLRNELYIFSAGLVAKWMHIPIVLEVDSPTAWEYRFRSGRNIFKLPILPEWIERWNWKISRSIITISDVLKKYLVEEGIPEDKITVIPNGADPEVFKPGLVGDCIRSRFGIRNQVVIGWAGSLYGWSGLERLLEMTRRMLRMRDDVVFLFIGGGKNRKIMESTFAPSDLDNRIFLTGTVPYYEIPRYIDAMDIVIVPYPKLDFWYPSSMKLFECMSSAKAVVASSVEQVKDIIVDGKNGFLFDPENIDECVRKVLLLADDPKLRKKMGQAARKTVMEKYTWIGHARKMEEVFLKVLTCLA